VRGDHDLAASLGYVMYSIMTTALMSGPVQGQGGSPMFREPAARLVAMQLAEQVRGQDSEPDGQAKMVGGVQDDGHAAVILPVHCFHEGDDVAGVIAGKPGDLMGAAR